MGAYYLPLMPIFQSVVDVPYDQGRQSLVHWNRSPLDYTYTRHVLFRLAARHPGPTAPRW
jgi:hypothetical protein